MAHYSVTNRKTGEVQFVQSRPGKKLEGYHDEDFEVRPLSRAPTEFDDYVGNRLTRNAEREAKRREDSRLGGMSRSERQAEAVRRAEDAFGRRLAKMGLANAD